MAVCPGSVWPASCSSGVALWVILAAEVPDAAAAPPPPPVQTAPAPRPRRRACRCGCAALLPSALRHELHVCALL